MSLNFDPPPSRPVTVYRAAQRGNEILEEGKDLVRVPIDKQEDTMDVMLRGVGKVLEKNENPWVAFGIIVALVFLILLMMLYRKN